MKTAMNHTPIATGALTVDKLMTREVKTSKPSDTLQAAARILWEGDCGSVPVVDEEGHVVSVLTDRDICMAALHQNRPLSDIAVNVAMSRQVWTVRAITTVQEAESVLRERQLHRLPVVDDHKRLVGIICLSDIAREAARQREKEDRQVTDAEVGQTLSAISKPHPAVKESKPPPKEPQPTAKKPQTAGAVG